MKIEVKDSELMKLSFQGPNQGPNAPLVVEYSFMLSAMKTVGLDLIYKKMDGFEGVPEITMKVYAQTEIQIIPTGCTLEEITAENATSVCTKIEDQKYITDVHYPTYNAIEIYRVYHSS